MYNNYVIFFYEDGVYKMINYTSSDMYDMLAKIVIMRNCADINGKKIDHLNIEDEFIEKNEVVFEGKHYKYGKYIKKSSVRYVPETYMP